MTGRYAQCDATCTTDCGHCKGAGRPAVTPESAAAAQHRPVWDGGTDGPWCACGGDWPCEQDATQRDDERAAATEQGPAGHGLLAQAAAIDAADRELEQTIRAWAAADDDLGWAGSPEVAQHAEELAGYLAEQGYGRPPVRSCCASRMGQRHAFGCAALAAAVHGQDEPPPAAAATSAQQDDDVTREDRAVAAGFVRRARAADSDDEVDAARDAIARDIAGERALVARPSADTETRAHVNSPDYDAARDYEALRDHVIKVLNPPDGDDGEVFIMMTAIDGAVRFIEQQMCHCTPARVEDYNPCPRCAVLGRLGDVRINR